MKFIKRAILMLTVTVLTFIFTKSQVYAQPTPIFDALTPKLQELMRIHAKKRMIRFPQYHPEEETLEDLAEQHLSGYNVYLDGSLYEGHEGPMKLTNEDIESLYNLPYVKQLDLERFDLKAVDINKFLGINNNKTMEFLDLRHCYFDTYDKKQIAARITNKEYTVDIDTNIWILWPGVDIYDIIDDGRLKNCH